MHLGSFRPVIVIGGPTASGKSAFAVDVAARFGGTVINGDSMQLYADLDVLTARPPAEDLARVPHRLYGVLPAAERGSAAKWRALALAEIAAAHAAGRLPVVVGGTGLYLRALMQGLCDVPDIPGAIRTAAHERLNALGGEAFRAELVARDPDSARLNPGDTTRLTRAWEVLEATGRPLSAWQRDAADGAPPGLAFLVVVIDPPRPALYAAGDGRFLSMVRRGALDEVRRLAALGLDPALPAMKALGVPELCAHLAGTLSLDDAIAKAQQATRHYAKRQVTWFRHQLAGRPPAAAVHGCHTLTSLYAPERSDAIVRIIDTIVRDHGIKE
ncbi:tRNA dimethylallyltransferase [Azospirillum fermentarium]|uniref:tRNA (adenosine(37)-N6)-dimethylallyltransferase MiaA n=1 Tax=Azospirillum fermentarium TaxID=1233114 RepID=UPI002227D297|nr:tRNA (adenosine(37)-N6)-dimethylallyltransferase MiaA [Azospirillum fermentarium]MCW2245030.1 tRNA dimethylallyltransferase [Azospirillum fermentarium]